MKFFNEFNLLIFLFLFSSDSILLGLVVFLFIVLMYWRMSDLGAQDASNAVRDARIKHLENTVVKMNDWTWNGWRAWFKDLVNRYV